MEKRVADQVQKGGAKPNTTNTTSPKGTAPTSAAANTTTPKAAVTSPPAKGAAPASATTGWKPAAPTSTTTSPTTKSGISTPPRSNSPKTTAPQSTHSPKAAAAAAPAATSAPAVDPATRQSQKSEQESLTDALKLVLTALENGAFSREQIEMLSKSIGHAFKNNEPVLEPVRNVELHPMLGKRPLHVSSEFLGETLSAISLKADGIKRYSYRSLINPDISKVEGLADAPEKAVPRRLSMISAQNVTNLGLSPLDEQERSVRRASLPVADFAFHNRLVEEADEDEDWQASVHVFDRDDQSPVDGEIDLEHAVVDRNNNAGENPFHGITQPVSYAPQPGITIEENITRGTCSTGDIRVQTKDKKRGIMKTDKKDQKDALPVRKTESSKTAARPKDPRAIKLRGSATTIKEIAQNYVNSVIPPPILQKAAKLFPGQRGDSLSAAAAKSKKKLKRSTFDDISQPSALKKEPKPKKNMQKVKPSAPECSEAPTAEPAAPVTEESPFSKPDDDDVSEEEYDDFEPDSSDAEESVIRVIENESTD